MGGESENVIELMRFSTGNDTSTATVYSTVVGYGIQIPSPPVCVSFTFFGFLRACGTSLLEAVPPRFTTVSRLTTIKSLTIFAFESVVCIQSITVKLLFLSGEDQQLVPYSSLRECVHYCYLAGYEPKCVCFRDRKSTRLNSSHVD